MSDETMRPCALCGAELHLSACVDEREWGVECRGCDGILIFRPSREEAIAVANRRADESRFRAEAAAERTREVVAIMERYISTTMAIDCVRVAYPEALPQPRSGEPAGEDRLGMPVLDLPEKATREQLVENIRALRGERRALLAETGAVLAEASRSAVEAERLALEVAGLRER